MRKVLEITFGGEEDLKTVIAANADQAMQLVASEQPAIALIDHSLGDTSGYDLCGQIKGSSPSTRVIILSSKHQPFDRGRGQSVGADDFFDKPFDTQRLIDKVRTVLSQAAPVRPAGAPAAAARPAAQPSPSPPAARPASAVPKKPAPASPEPVRAQTLSYGQSPPPAAAQSSVPQRPPPRVGGTLTGSPAVAPNPPPAQPAAAAPVQKAPAASPATGGAVLAAQSAAQTAAQAATSGNGQLAERLQGLGLSSNQVDAVLSLSREVVEQVVWEVVPVLAETLIKEEIKRLTSE
jgi:DNA-binding NarL/FixJ family response regulator